ncbi:MAG: hypothetical protein OEZ06_27995 [Myxococcales bacterium]|nr:hypothetical protein [Myxococcales bacterium]
MISEARQKKIDDATESLKRVHDFDVKTLARTDLGTLNFEDAIPHARRLVELSQQVALEILDGLPMAQLDLMKSQAVATYARLQQVLDFNLDGQNPKAERDGLINQLEADYDPLWQQLQQAISYSARRQMNFASLEREARGHMQLVKDAGSRLQGELEESKKEAAEILEEIRKVAAEQGVSQQAIYFKEECDDHAKRADEWLKTTKGATIALGVFAFATIFLHKWRWLAPTNDYETVQLAVSKVLVFATIASFVVLSARNFLAHRHNAVVNKHRQNALVTYQALVEAAADSSNREIILVHASECIFSPQPTGFGKGEKSDGSFSMVNLAGDMKVPPAGR